MPTLLWTSYLRYLRKNLWLLLLSLSAIATGVAVILAIDVASISAKRSFQLSLQALTGKSNYAVVGPGGTIEEEFYKTLRVDWAYRRSAPVVEGYLSFPSSETPDDPNTSVPLTLLGVEPFADGEFRDWTGGEFSSSAEADSPSMSDLIGSDDRVIATSATAQRLGWELGKKRTVRVGGEQKELLLAGVFKPASDRSSQALDNVLLTDISVAQSIFGWYGKLTRIDLIVTPEEKAELEKRLPDGLFLQKAGQSQQTASELSSAFHTNLRALSYLCLLVAVFLIFNVVSFSVSHRRRSLGRLRILGVTARELGVLLFGEALVLGALGSLLGVTLGLVLGRTLVPLVTRTLNDLYYVHAITQFRIDPLLLLKAYLCGLLATGLAALVPSILAARTEPLTLLRLAQSSKDNHRGLLVATSLGFLVLLAALLLLWDPSLTAGLLSLLFLVLGYGLLVPLILNWASLFGGNVVSSVSGKMALRGITAYLRRTSLAAVALTIAVAATVSIGMMVSSFRGTLTSWLETTLTADIYITLKDRAGLNSGAALSDSKIQAVRDLPQVRDWTAQRFRRVPSATGETFLVGIRSPEAYQSSLVFLESVDQVWERFQRGEGILITEPYSRRAKLSVGSQLEFASPLGSQRLPVLGVYYSYAPDRNLAMMAAPKFQELFSDPAWSGLGLYLQPDADVTEVVTEVRRIFGEDVEVRATGNLKKLALEIFDRTFTVTEVLRFLALGVAFIGVFLSLLALAFERAQEVRVLRALGLSQEELFRLSLTQSVFMGFIAGILAFPLGAVLSKVMISVINRRAFGWTITFEMEWWGTLEALALALLAALLAGFYPAWKWSHQAADEALRETE